jgi:FkbM family methyltransferase
MDFKALKYISGDSGHLYIDIGANYGQSIESILRYKPDVKIISFEPNLDIVKWLKGVYSRKNNVEIRDYGIGDKNGELDLFVPTYRGFSFDGLASFKEVEAISNINKETLYGFKDKYLKIQKVKCVIMKLDSLDLKPFFIKIDTEGYEQEVVLGGRETIKRFLPILLIENFKNNDEIAKLLKRWGYRIYRFQNGCFYRDQIGYPNSFLIPEKKLNFIDCSKLKVL